MNTTPNLPTILTGAGILQIMTAQNAILAAALTPEPKVHVFTLAGMGEAPFVFAGFYEMPDPSESSAATFGNPGGIYAGAPNLKAGLGTCAACGTAISNVYIVRNRAGELYGVGCDCVEKSGEAGLISKVKHEQKRQRRAKADAKRIADREAYLASPEFAAHKAAQAQAVEDQRLAEIAKRDAIRAKFPAVIAALEDAKRQGSHFFASLLEQLTNAGSLSKGQAPYVAQLVIGGRRKKANAEQGAGLGGGQKRLQATL